MNYMHHTEKDKHHNPFRQAFKISIIYFLFSSVWIIVTDLVNVAYRHDGFREYIIEAGKGMLFVIISSILIFLLVKKYFSAYRQSSRELAEKETEYKSLTEHLKVGIIKSTSEGKYIFMNNAARNILQDYLKPGIAGNITGLYPEEIYKDDDLISRVKSTVSYIKETGESIVRKVKYGERYLSVHTYPELGSDGKIVSVHSILTDETELMQNIIHLEETERFNSHLVDSSHVVVYIYDLKSSNQIFANKALERILGYNLKEIRDPKINILNELMHPDDTQRMVDYVQKEVMLLKDGEVSEFEYRMKHKDGHYCWFKSHDCVFMRDENGLPLQILGSAIDITDLKRSREEADKNLTYLNSIIDVSPIAILNLDREGKVLNIWNIAAEGIFGWKKEEVLGKKLPIIPADKSAEFEEFFGSLLNGHSINGVEFLRRRKDGSPVNVRIYAAPVTGSDGRVESILSYIVDITLEKNFAETKQKNLDYLKLLYEASLAANKTMDTSELYRVCFGFIKDIVDVTGIMVSLVTNDNRFIKYDSIWVKGENIDVSKVPLMKLDPSGEGPLTRTILTGEAQIVDDLESRVKNSSNKFFVDEDGNLSEPCEEVKNVSHAALLIPLKHAEKVIGVLQVQNYVAGKFNTNDLLRLEPFAFIFASAIQRSKLYNKLHGELEEKASAFEQLRKFTKGIEQSPNSIVITNSESEIEYVNPYFTELTGFTLEEVLGKNPSILKSGQTDGNVYAGLWEALSKGETWHGEFLNLKKNGDLYWEAASIGPITDAAGKVTHYIAIKQDITEKKKKDKELKDSLEEKEIMLKEIHHRVKNNLQVISSLLNMQVEQYEHPEAIDAINSSRNRVKAMALVHENLYQSENIGKTSLKEYLIMLAKNIYSSYGVSFERVKFYCETHGIEFGLDTIIPLGLILNEGISNSLKHAFPQGAHGEIKVEFESLDKNNTAGFEGSCSRERFRLRIKDNGKGLPENFDPEKTNSLGMTLLTSLAAQLDGEAVINNKVGTEIIIDFKELKYKTRV